MYPCSFQPLDPFKSTRVTMLEPFTVMDTALRCVGLSKA